MHKTPIKESNKRLTLILCITGFFVPVYIPLGAVLQDFLGGGCLVFIFRLYDHMGVCCLVPI